MDSHPQSAPCPLCHCPDVHYTFHVRRWGFTIAVRCERCRYFGPEVTMQNDEDVQAADRAAVQWNEVSGKLARVGIGYPESRTLQ
jgi:hypothetical protein